MNKMIAVLVGLVVLAVAGSASAECSQDDDVAQVVVPEWSYAYVVHEFEDSESPYLWCEHEAEAIVCAQENLTCARAMQVAYTSCVGRFTCREFSGGAHVACMALVAAEGGEY